MKKYIPKPIAHFLKSITGKKYKFETSHKYWLERYKNGGNSGSGSYDKLAEFKAEVLNLFVRKNNINSVIEFGCGDGNQLRYFNFPAYLGYDVSPHAVGLCESYFHADKTKQFKLVKDYTRTPSDLVLSLDVIYHLVEEEVYVDYMNMLFDALPKFVIIYSSNTNENSNFLPHVKCRKFTEWVAKNKPSYKLIQHIPNKYSYQEGVVGTSFADFFIFQKID